MPVNPDRRPANYDANARCEFHYGGVGHSIENCYALKCKIQDFLDSKAIQFEAAAGPNVIQHPMPSHDAAVNAIIGDGEWLDLVMDVNHVTTSLPYVKRYLSDNGIFPGCDPVCCKCMERPKGCDDLKARIQELINDGSLQFGRARKYRKVTPADVSVVSIPFTLRRIHVAVKPVPLMITLPGPLPYDSEKAIPWHYGADVYYHGVKQDSGLSKNSFVKDNDVDVHNLSGEGHLMRSGRVLSPPNLQGNADALAK